VKTFAQVGFISLLLFALALPASAAPAPAGDRPRASHPEDRPFTGDPGGEPPPPPVRPREKVRKRPVRPARPARPVEPKKPEPPVDRDLLRARGPNIIAAGVGVDAGLTEPTTGGFRLNLEWSYQLTRLLWFDVIGGASLGGDCKVLEEETTGGVTRVINSRCNAFGGIGIDLLAGIQMKLVNIRLWKVPVVPFARVAAGVAFIIADTPNDGAALVVRVGGGARYYFTNWFSVGAELAFTLGPAFRNHLDPGFYTKLELLAGVEFLL
jgi:hypothetical protein